MKAIGYQRNLPCTDHECLIDGELPEPVAAGRDLLVRVKAVSVNPVDTKVRLNVTPAVGEFKVLGFDAAGVVESVGPGVTLFRPGDEVWYAGSRARSGTNAELHLVDERIVGHKPKRLDFAQAAAMPLTAITAWEALFDRLGVARLPMESVAQNTPWKAINRGGDATLLITAAAGGVGSMAVQLARHLTALTVIATASRPESKAQAERLGAHVVIAHPGRTALPLQASLSQAMQAAGLRWARYIFSVSHTHQHFAELCKIIAPQGKICVIDDPDLIDVRLLKARCASLHWEAMFARSGFQTADMAEQGQLLNQVAQLVDGGIVQCTHSQTLGKINAANLRLAHAMVESGTSIGKITLAEF
jgi:NADPH:quinone reductase